MHIDRLEVKVNIFKQNKIQRLMKIISDTVKASISHILIVVDPCYV